MTTFCSKCGVELKEEVNENYIMCHKCKRLTPKGANSLKVIPKQLSVKGGNRMKTQLKEQLAGECITFLEGKSVSAEDMTKVLSTAYRNAAKNKPKSSKKAKEE